MFLAKGFENTVSLNFGSEENRKSLASKFEYAHFNICDKDGNRVGSATVGGALVPVNGSSRLFYSVALCSPCDNFCKAEGRKRVHEHMIDQRKSSKRGVLELNYVDARLPPPRVLEKALIHQLGRLRQRPAWLPETCSIDFRSQPRKKVEEKSQEKTTTCDENHQVNGKNWRAYH